MHVHVHNHVLACACMCKRDHIISVNRMQSSEHRKWGIQVHSDQSSAMEFTTATLPNKHVGHSTRPSL